MKNEQPNPEPEWICSLVERHAPDLTRYVASILGDPDSAKDVVQDAFMRLWQVPRPSVEDHARAWLFRVCRNRALDVKRKGGRMKPLAEKHTAVVIDEDPGPGSQVERQDSHDQLMELMRALPDNQQEVVRLKFQNGMSYKEIASVTDLSVTNVGYLIHTAIQRLRASAQAAGE